MTRFHYIARTDGYETRGVIAAADKSEAIQHLAGQGYDRVRVKPVRATLRQFLSRLLATR